MAHQAIYRKWRPMTFDDVVGQNHITRTLKNQIVSGAVGHAYLFCGTRGTGKTTCAKVLARAVNCLNPVNGNPCNECEICRGIIDGSIMDVTEMDAASNNGVDNIRNIREDINYIASNAKYTVYIIDEVHMLSTGAFNALLKTLEEPPENVIFILATTESHKVPQTILSRCQRFDFRRIRNDDIIVRMKEIAHADGYDITDSAYRMLASLADGSMRDGLSIMERVISTSGATVTDTDIVNALGISTQETVFDITDAIINSDSAAVIGAIDKAVSDGRELSLLAESVLSHLRSLMICKLTDNPEGLIETDANTLARMRSQSGRLTFDRINRASTLISEAMADARLAKSARIIYELAFIKITRPETDRSPDGGMARLSAVEQKLAVGVPQQPAPQTANKSSDILRRISAIEEAIKNGQAPKAEDEKKTEPVEKKKVSHRLYAPIPESELTYEYPTAALARNWNNTIAAMTQQNKPYVTPLKNCTVTFDAEGLILLAPEERNTFTQPFIAGHIDEIREVFRQTTGMDYNIKIARRSDLDESCILNPYELPHSEGSGTAEPVKHSETKENIVDSDRLDEFISKFSNIITDGDRVTFDAEPETGVQTSMEDLEDEREEFLEANELPSDEE